MNEQPVSVSRISWQELCPWTSIFKTLSIAISPSVLVWALLGVVVTPIGWLLGEMLFFSDAMSNDEALSALAERNRSPYKAVFLGGESATDSIPVFGTNLSGPLLVFRRFVEPFNALFHQVWSAWEYCYFAFGAIWSLLVWSFVGCAITRVCLLRLTRNEALSMDEAFDFASAKYFDCLGAIGMPLLGVVLLCIPMFLIGLLLTFNLGAFIMSLLWFLVLATAAVIVLLLIGLMFGWPLIVSSIAAEGQNSFDATTRAFAYTIQRPLNYAFYALIAVLFGGFCWVITRHATDTVIDMSYWATSWGANLFDGDRIDEIRTSEEAVGTLYWSQKVTGFWNAFARTIAAAFLYGLFWCMSASVYLLLRRDVDETEMDEIYISNEQRTYDLPPLKSDEMGIPQIQEPMPTSEPREDSYD